MTEEYKPHPEGVFAAKLVEWGDIKRSRTQPLFHMPAILDTEHGRTWAYFAGMPNTLTMIKRAEAYYQTIAFKIRVKHVHIQGMVYASSEIQFERGEFEIRG